MPTNYLILRQLSSIGNHEAITTEITAVLQGHTMIDHQTFIDPESREWLELDFLPGVKLMPLAEPLAGGSIHRVRLSAGTVIPVHTHPADEYVFVLSGTVDTGGRRCEAGTFWKTPAGFRQGPHIAITDVELYTVRLGPMGSFGE